MLSRTYIMSNFKHLKTWKIVLDSNKYLTYLDIYYVKITIMLFNGRENAACLMQIWSLIFINSLKYSALLNRFKYLTSLMNKTAVPQFSRSLVVLPFLAILEKSSKCSFPGTHRFSKVSQKVLAGNKINLRLATEIFTASQLSY